MFLVVQHQTGPTEKQQKRKFTCDTHSSEVVQEQCHHVYEQHNGNWPGVEDHLQNQSSI